MVGFNRRYWAPVRQLRDLLGKSRYLGRVSARLVITSDVQAWAPIDKISDPLDDLAPHQLDAARYIFDRDIQAVSARWADKQTIELRVVLEDGIVAECLAAHSNISQESMTIQWESREYRIRMGSERIRPAGGPGRALLDLSDAVRRRLRGRETSMRTSFERQLIRFFDAIRAADRPQPGIADGIAVVQAVQAARRSAANSGMEVTTSR